LEEPDGQDTALGEALDSGLEQGGNGGDDLDLAELGGAGIESGGIADELDSDDDGESGGAEPDIDLG
jgi:hypothetical protein